MPYPKRGNASGSSASSFGPANNLFGDISGDINASPTGVSPATDKATAEATRDAYFTANPDNLAVYDADFNIVIRLLFNTGSDIFYANQHRQSGEWVSESDVLGTDFSNIPANNVPAIDENGQPFSSGMRVLTNGQLLAPTDFGVESGSIDFGDLLTLSEKGGFLGIDNKQSQRTYNLIDFYSPNDAPASRPRIFAKTESEKPLVIQPVDTELLNSGPISFSYTTTLSAYTNAITLKASAEMTNVRARISDVASGVAFKYYPSKQDWINGTGATLNTGTNPLSLGDTPIPLTPGAELTIDIHADNYSLLGDTAGVPYFAIVKQNAEFRTIPIDGALVGVVDTSASTKIMPNSNVWVGFSSDDSGEEIVLNLEDGNQALDRIVIHNMFNISGNTLRINASSIGFVSNTGQLVTDTEVTTSTSRKLEFTWGGSRWNLNI